MLHRAVTFDKIDRNPYDRLKFKRGETENIEYLTEDEMKAIVNLKVPTGTPIEVARDLFVFQMYTGLSYSDTQAFDFSKYKKVKGKWINTGERIKTGVAYVSSLLPPAVAVLEKYGWTVPKIDNADYNHLLKVVGTMANIQTKMHTHLARHTFATWMLRNGAKIENVSRMLGHTNIRQTQRYAKVLAEAILFMAFLAWLVIYIAKKSNKSYSQTQADIAAKMYGSKPVKRNEDIVADIENLNVRTEAMIQSMAVGDEATYQAIMNETYQGPWPERRGDGGWLSMYDNLRILKIAGINYRKGIASYTGRVMSALVPEPGNEYDPEVTFRPIRRISFARLLTANFPIVASVISTKGMTRQTPIVSIMALSISNGRTWSGDVCCSTP